jgi:hypothetical protein
VEVVVVREFEESRIIVILKNVVRGFRKYTSSSPHASPASRATTFHIPPSRCRSRRGLDELFVHVTPAPILTGLEAPHDGMLYCMEVFGRVLALRLVTASHMSALQTEP